ncbi:MAG TPA: hypothetical protein VNL95_07125 [Dehalococcoidia bacterium]|nr:hypothetical protein [Dehalococcoidia bacterium]
MGLSADAALPLAVDAVAGICGLLNATYFLGYLLTRARGPSYRVAAAALALASAAVAAESGVLLAWRGGAAAGQALDGAWGLSRLLTALGTVAVTLLVLRRIVALSE